MKFFIILVVTFSYIHDVTSASEGRECITTGPMCENCSLLVTCVRNEYGFTKIPLETCADGYICLQAACVKSNTCGCRDDLSFPCNDIGVFPDPFDYQSYHFCVPSSTDTHDSSLQHYEARCYGSWGYHAGTTFCQTKLENNMRFPYNTNQFPIDSCLYSGQTGALAQNPTIYYICAPYGITGSILYPFQYVCPHGGTYYNYQCFSALKQNLNKLMSRI